MLLTRIRLTQDNLNTYHVRCKATVWVRVSVRKIHKSGRLCKIFLLTSVLSTGITQRVTNIYPSRAHTPYAHAIEASHAASKGEFRPNSSSHSLGVLSITIKKRNACEAKHSLRLASLSCALDRSCTQCANARHRKTFEIENEENKKGVWGGGGRKGKIMVHARWTARILHACQYLSTAHILAPKICNVATVTIIATADTEPRDAHEQQKKHHVRLEVQGISVHNSLPGRTAKVSPRVHTKEGHGKNTILCGTNPIPLHKEGYDTYPGTYKRNITKTCCTSFYTLQVYTTLV